MDAHGANDEAGQGTIPSALERLAHVADRLAERTTSPRRFLIGLAWNCAGIRPGSFGFLDLASGGRNRFSGRGFRSRFDDGTDGQVRHFAGVAVSPVFLGDPLARFAAIHLLGDPPDTADGRLSSAAFTFSAEIRRGNLPLVQAGAWIRRELAERRSNGN